MRAVPTVLALLLLDVAIDWNGAKGAAFAMLGSSSLAVIGFYVAILNLSQIRLVVEPEAKAKDLGLKVLTLDVRNTQEAAIKLYDSLGYKCWGVNARYAFIDGEWVGGMYYNKDLTK